MAKAIDLTGVKYGHLTPLYRDSNNHRKWVCKCDCGNIKSINISNLRAGKTKSCGCRQGQNGTINGSYKHGGTHTKLYNVWKTMRQRCNNPNSHDYKYYGGRGIGICKEWSDFSVFKDWAVGNGYNDGLTLERKDNNDNYCPNNCTWITIQDQQRHRRNNHLLEYNGEIHPMSVWSGILKMNYSVLRDEVRKGKTLYEIMENLK